METDTSRRVIESGSQQYNQFPFHSSPRKKKEGNVIGLYFAKRNSLNCTSTEMLLLYVEKRKITYIPLFVQGRGMDDRQPSQ